MVRPFRHRTAVFVVASGLAACSADSAGRSSHPNQDPSSGQGGSIGGGGGGNGGGGSGSGGNIQVGNGGAGGGGGGGVQLPPAMTVMDDCGASNAAGLTPAEVQTLAGVADPAGAMRVVYPYDQTVFPRGMLAPMIMWDGDGGGTPDAVYVHLRSASFEYKGCLKATAAGQVQLSQDAWDAAGAHTGGSADPYHVEIALWSKGAAKGPMRQTIEIAPATIKGSVYYNSYSSKLGASGGMTSSWGGGTDGKILRIPPKKPAEAFITNTCIGCHSVSANGSRLIASGSMGSGTFALTPTTAPNPPGNAAGSVGCFPGIYPDGSIFVSTAMPMNVNLAHCGSGNSSKLLRSDNGAAVPGASISPNAVMPTFAPDGSALVWIDAATPKNVAIAAFDHASSKATGEHVIYTDGAGTTKPGWPFILPDNGAVLFERSNSDDYTSGGSTGKAGTAVGDLYIVDLKGGTSNILARAMGFATPADAASDKSDLPFGKDEIHRNYFPTVSPVAAGGYFWIFFDSLRHYGNQGLQRQLWGAAVAVSADGTYAADPSRPAFYVSGQEFGTGNHRAFTALDPCLQAGTSCSSGVDCCGGYCTDGSCNTPAAPRCSNTDETCTVASDCCDTSAHCINGFCALVTIIPK